MTENTASNLSDAPVQIDVAELLTRLQHLGSPARVYAARRYDPVTRALTVDLSAPQSLVDLNPGWRMYIPALAARLSRMATGELKPLALLVLMGQLWADILVEHIPPDLQDVLPLGTARVLRLAYPDLQADQPNLWRVVLPPLAAEAMVALEAQMAALPPDDSLVKASVPVSPNLGARAAAGLPLRPT